MKCESCCGSMAASSTTRTADLPAGRFILHHVPCFECVSCGAVVVPKEEQDIVDRTAENVKDIIDGEYEIDWAMLNNP